MVDHAIRKYILSCALEQFQDVCKSRPGPPVSAGVHTVEKLLTGSLDQDECTQLTICLFLPESQLEPANLVLVVLQ